MNPSATMIASIMDDLIRTRKALHRIPEVGFQENKTAAYVADDLESLDLEVTRGVAGTGVIALLRGDHAGPTLALRACLDALAMTECSGVDYASEHPGAFHGCGHDGNMAFVLGAAKVLARCREQLHGNVKFMFQPSEEETGGAAALIRAGALKRPDVDAIVHLHNWHDLGAGVIAIKAGPVLASSDTFRIEIIGSPGHGAWPHLAVDPVVVAAEVVTALQRILSREIDPLKPALLTLGRIHGGTAVNIIPESVVIEGLARAYHPEVRDHLQTRIGEVVEGVTRAARATHQTIYNRIMPPVTNDGKLAAWAARTLGALPEPAIRLTEATPGGMGAEDFSLYQQEVPGLFLFIGKDEPGREVIPIHAPNYIFNDNTLGTGVRALCALALGFCRRT
ncbi:MAG TPA: M20 family metallopeptidase [Geothrix sp.]|nr:M20 family metallopeptidase [Geothrix sp.]